MAERHYVGGYWDNRPETLEECARRAARLLEGLSRCDKVFSRWLTKGRSLEEASRYSVDPSEQSLSQLLERGRNRRDSNGSVIEDLGFRLGLWNGDAESEVGLSLHCGSYASTPVVWVPNRCVLNLPAAGPALERVHDVAMLLRILEELVGAYEPDWAVVTSHAYQETTSQREARVPEVGWITYLSRAYGELPALRAPAAVVPMGSFGSVVVSTEERFTASNPQHVKTANEVRAALEKAGVLRRLA